VRAISCETAFLGKHELFFDDDEILADALTQYYTDYEPTSCFVAESESAVVGYIIGAKDVTRMATIFWRDIFNGLLIKAWQHKVFFQRKASSFFLHIAVSALRGEFISPHFARQYPAALHINIRQGFRGQGVGTRLIARYVSYARETGVKGIHFGVFSHGAREFFEKTGFKVLFKGNRSFFRYRLGEDVPFFVLGKIL